MVKFTNFLKDTLPRAKKGLLRAGFVVEAQIKKNLSGRRTPSNPYPGIGLTQQLRDRVNTTPSDEGMVVRVGPHVVYAAIHEFGGQTGRGGKTTIPKRPYVAPAWKQSRDKVIDIMRRAVRGAA